MTTTHRPPSAPRAADGPRHAEPPPLEVRWLGTVPYGDALALQDEQVALRRAGHVPDQLLLLEHPHVITLGTGSDASHVLLDEAERKLMGIELFDTGRGGDVTYHGPGQLVGYPILDLTPDRKDLHRYVRDIEEALIRSLAHLGVNANRIQGLTGVWVEDAKVAAIGVRVSSGWITSHGFALNVATNLDFFDAIVPCGIHDRDVTSLERLLGRAPSMAELLPLVAHEFAAVFRRSAVDMWKETRTDGEGLAAR